MARNLTPKQERFCQLYVELGEASNAYREAYPAAKKWKPEAVWPQASRMLAKPMVAARIRDLQAKHAERHEVTLDSLVAELELARAAAMAEDPSKSAAVSATMGKAKLLGFVVDKHKVQGTVTVQKLPPLTPKAAKAVLEMIEAERF